MRFLNTISTPRLHEKCMNPKMCASFNFANAPQIAEFTDLKALW